MASENLNIKIIDTRHEVTAVFAADAAARLRPGMTHWYGLRLVLLKESYLPIVVVITAAQ